MDYQHIYTHHAPAYDALVNAEDCDGHLGPAIEAIAPLAGAAVLEVGAGTGRLTRLLVGRGARVVAIDRSPAMLELARHHLDALKRPGWRLEEADARALPVPSGWAALALAGWALGHLRHWHPDTWRAEIGLALGEMERALAPGGVLLLLETLGTGSTVPAPPNAALAEYFDWLESAHGMQRVTLRTDYRFPDVETAARITGFFFGDAFAERVRAERWSRVPECTGLWWRRV